MLDAQGFWARKDLYRATPAVTRGLVFSGLIRRTASFNRLLRNTRVCGGSILNRILMGPHSVSSYETQGDAENLFLPGCQKVRNFKDFTVFAASKKPSIFLQIDKYFIHIIYNTSSWGLEIIQMLHTINLLDISFFQTELVLIILIKIA
jgi:hypothetical protein